MAPIVVWNRKPGKNVDHVADHGLTSDEVEEVLLDDTLSTQTSNRSGRPCKFGWTSTGKHIIVVWIELNGDPGKLYPITAYPVPPPS